VQNFRQKTEWKKTLWRPSRKREVNINLLKPTCYVMHQQV